MPREVISPQRWADIQRAGSAQKQPPSLTELMARSEAERAERAARAQELLTEAFSHLTDDEQRQVRMGVALVLPERPMSPEELQLWLDERCIGVARYMVTGKIK